MYALETKYHGPGNVRGSRVIVNCCICEERTTVSYDDIFDAITNHEQAALQHLDKHHRTPAGDLRSTVEHAYETRAGYVFPVLPLPEHR